MTRPIPLMWAFVSVICLIAFAITAPEALSARSAAARAESDLASTRGQIDELVAQRTRVALNAAVDEDAGTLAERVAWALADAGLPADALAGMSPTSVTPIGARDTDASIVRKRATLILAGATLPDIGRFLGAWREREPAWTITAAELRPMSGAGVSPGGDLPIRATLTIEAVALGNKGSGG